MNNELLLLIKEHTDTHIDQTKTKPQETLQFKLIKQMETFSFSRPIYLDKEGKWPLSVTFFEATESVFDITDGNNSFSITTPGHWNSQDAEELINNQKKY